MKIYHIVDRSNSPLLKKSRISILAIRGSE